MMLKNCSKRMLWMFVALIIFWLQPTLTAGAETGLVGEWHFDGDAKDSSGNGNHGTINGATFVQGISGQALRFDGSNDYVSVPDAPSFTVSEVTVEAWIKPDNTVFQGIVTNHANGVDADGSWVLYKSDKVCFIIFTNTGEQLPACGGSISASSWYHVVGTWSSSSGSKIYLNGVNVGTVTTSGTLPDPINPVEIGRYHVYNPPNQYWFNGIIDEVHIYNRALGAEEIKAAYSKYADKAQTQITPTSPARTLIPTPAIELPKFNSGISAEIGKAADMNTLHQRVDKVYTVLEHDDSHIIWKFTGTTGDYAFVYADGRLIVGSMANFDLSAKDTLEKELNAVIDMINVISGVTQEEREQAVDHAIYYASEAGVYQRIKYTVKYTESAPHFTLKLQVPNTIIKNGRLTVIGISITCEGAKGAEYKIDRKTVLIQQHNTLSPPVYITNEIPAGVHEIYGQYPYYCFIYNPATHTFLIEAYTTPADKKMVLYSDDYKTWIEDTTQSLTLDKLYELISRPAAQKPTPVQTKPVVQIPQPSKSSNAYIYLIGIGAFLLLLFLAVLRTKKLRTAKPQKLPQISQTEIIKKEEPPLLKPEPALEIGKMIKHYEILSRIGRGGMGWVYKAKDTVLDSTVAIKVLSPELAGSEEAGKRFLREAKAQAKLRGNSNVVSIYDFGEDNGINYIVMEYLDGGSLQGLLKRGYLTIDKAKNIFLQVCSGLEAAHAQGIIHRDIKPSNILLTKEGTAKLSDFGLARFGESSTTGGVKGTLLYMSPEQIKGDQVDKRSDIYSLGATLYEMLTGRMVFYADNEVAIMYKHLHENPTNPRVYNPGISERLEKLILKALSKAPEDRFQSVREMMEYLK